MHDNTNITLNTSTDADKQQSLNSEYYGECCAKGGGSIKTLRLDTRTYIIYLPVVLTTANIYSD